MSASMPETMYEQLFFVTVRIEAKFPNDRTSVGTGFFYTVPLAKDQGTAFFLVTNKHVMAGAQSVSIHFIKANEAGGPMLGEIQTVVFQDFKPENYFGHPDPGIDVAVIAISGILTGLAQAGQAIFFRSLGSESVPTLIQLEDLDAIENVRFIGYPDGIYDSQNYLPIVRRGATASYLQHDYEGKPTFLIDASVFPGSSGSPVLIADSGLFTTKKGTNISSRILLLGVLAAVRQTQRVGQLLVLPTSTVSPVVPETLDLGIVYKARTIDECVDALLLKNGLARADVSAAIEPTAAEVAADKAGSQNA